MARKAYSDEERAQVKEALMVTMIRCIADSKQPKEKLGHKEQVNFVKYPILNRAQKRDIVNVSKGNTVYIMLLSIVFCVDARCSATGTSRSAVFFCLESWPIITGQGECVNYM